MAADSTGSEELKNDVERSLRFFASFYDSIGSWTLLPGKIEPVLGKNEVQHCRFCGGYPPAVSFQQEAHAIPEALGNKTLFASYECDGCNQNFGRGIENDLGNWSKPMRTLSLISGKSGIPTLKGKSPKEWRVEGTQTGLHLKHHAEDVVATVDEVRRTMTLSLPRDSYSPRAVFKAFVKIGLALIPTSDTPFYRETFSWIAESDHSKPFSTDYSIVAQDMRGPPGNRGLGAAILRRADDYVRLPFCVLILFYGSQVFQISIPSSKNWAVVSNKAPWFPIHSGETVAKWGMPTRHIIDLSGSTVVKGEIQKITMTYDQRIPLNDL
jgi:HNH endonuclease